MLLVVIISVLIIATWSFFRFNLQFGGRINTDWKHEYAKSKQWNGKIFENQSVTTMDMSLKTIPSLLKQQFTDRKLRSPQKPIPIIPFNKEAFSNDLDEPKFVWYGHSALLLQLSGKNLLIDPMLGPDTAPIAPFANKRFSENTLEVIDQLPHIDAILLTHDHYDHLDYASIKKLKSKVDTWFVALGVSRHLERWGIPTAQITKFDWWQHTNFQGIELTFTPTRHFSGRGLTDRAKSLWGGWVLKTPNHSIYWSGDSGYDEHFKEVGKRLGPFDWGFLECGQYHEYWHQIHMYPEETVQSAIDSGVKVSIPVHWAGFPLSLHNWKNPIERFTKEAELKGNQISTPEIGEVVIFGDEPVGNWWEDLN